MFKKNQLVEPNARWYSHEDIEPLPEILRVLADNIGTNEDT